MGVLSRVQKGKRGLGRESAKTSSTWQLKEGERYTSLDEVPFGCLFKWGWLRAQIPRPFVKDTDAFSRRKKPPQVERWHWLSC